MDWKWFINDDNKKNWYIMVVLMLNLNVYKVVKMLIYIVKQRLNIDYTCTCHWKGPNSFYAAKIHPVNVYKWLEC